MSFIFEFAFMNKILGSKIDEIYLIKIFNISLIQSQREMKEYWIDAQHILSMSNQILIYMSCAWAFSANYLSFQTPASIFIGIFLYFNLFSATLVR